MITTVLDMIEGVKMGVDKTSSFEAVSFEENEILYWLNESQITVIKQKFYGNNFRKQDIDDYSKGFKRPEDLSRLIDYSEYLYFHPDNISPNFRPHAYHPNVAVTNIFNNSKIPHYLFYIGCDFKATKDLTWEYLNGIDPSELSSKPLDDPQMPPMEAETVEMKDIGYFVETPYNKPYLKNAFTYLKEGEVNVMYDSFVRPIWLRISYLYEPKTLTLSPTIGEWETSLTDITEIEGTVPVQMRTEIVANAVNMMLENVKDPRYQSHTIELTRQE